MKMNNQQEMNRLLLVCHQGLAQMDQLQWAPDLQLNQIIQLLSGQMRRQLRTIQLRLDIKRKLLESVQLPLVNHQMQVIATLLQLEQTPRLRNQEQSL